MTEAATQEQVEHDIEFDASLALIRIVGQADAAKLMHAMLKVAFNNGVIAGTQAMAKIADNAFEKALSAGQRGEKP